MKNYSPQLARDKSGEPLQEYPAPIIAKQVFSSENASTSSVISVSHDTTAIEIAAVRGAAAMKWITIGNTDASVVSATSGANFDHIIAPGTVRRFVIPQEVIGSNQSSIQGVNRGEGLYQRVAYKSMGIASVLLTEY